MIVKKQIVRKMRIQEELKQTMENAKSIVFVDFRGLKVSDDTRLRRACREEGVHYKVIKNSLATRAVSALGWQGLDDVFKGPTSMATSETDPVAAAKVLVKFSREAPAIRVKAGVLEGGQVLAPERVAFLGTLPSREELLARVAGAAQSPITALVWVLNGSLTSFARAVDALRQKKEEAAD